MGLCDDQHINPSCLVNYGDLRYSKYVRFERHKGAAMNIMTVTDPNTGEQSAIPMNLSPMRQAMWQAAAERQGMVITFTTR